MSDLPSVEVTDEALGDVARQLDPDAAWSFTRLDMLPALEAMAVRWPDLPEVQGAPGRRYSADGLTVPLFHLLAVGPDNGPIIVYASTSGILHSTRITEQPPSWDQDRGYDQAGSSDIERPECRTILDPPLPLKRVVSRGNVKGDDRRDRGSVIN